jgi:hypothetical protein
MIAYDLTPFGLHLEFIPLDRAEDVEFTKQVAEKIRSFLGEGRVGNEDFLKVEEGIDSFLAQENLVAKKSADEENGNIVWGSATGGYSLNIVLENK